jgi:hypothetical protein
MLRGVGWQIVIEVSGQNIGLILNRQAVKEELTARNTPEERRQDWYSL